MHFLNFVVGFAVIIVWRYDISINTDNIVSQLYSYRYFMSGKLDLFGYSVTDVSIFLVYSEWGSTQNRHQRVMAN